MIRINQLKLPLNHTPERIKGEAAGRLGISPGEIAQVHIRRQSPDGRKKPELFMSIPWM